MTELLLVRHHQNLLFELAYFFYVLLVVFFPVIVQFPLAQTLSLLALLTHQTQTRLLQFLPQTLNLSPQLLILSLVMPHFLLTRLHFQPVLLQQITARSTLLSQRLLKLPYVPSQLFVFLLHLLQALSIVHLLFLHECFQVL